MKEGQGTLLLRGTNQHDGGTTVNAGTLQISRDANLGRGALALNDGTLQSTGSFATSRGHLARPGHHGGRRFAYRDLEWRAERRRHVAQSQARARWPWPAPTTYSGGTVVEAGALRAGHEDNLGRGRNNPAGRRSACRRQFSSNRDLTLVRGSLDVVRDATLTWNGAISGAGDLVKTGDRTLALTGVNGYAGQTVLRQGKAARGRRKKA